IDDQRELALQHDVDLLLLPVAMDATPLAGPQQDQVQPEAGDAQLRAQLHEALARVEIEDGVAHARLHGGGCYAAVPGRQISPPCPESTRCESPAGRSIRTPPQEPLRRRPTQPGPVPPPPPPPCA